jgi:ribokinase
MSESAPPQPGVCVVGSANVDLIAYVSRPPLVGETVSGSRFETGFGGKGANQAAMAAKLGAHLQMVARLGDDVFGRDYMAELQRLGIDTEHVTITPGTSTGVAPIWVDESTGDNAIIVVLGANTLLSPDDVRRAGSVFRSSSVCVVQWEIPTDAVIAALRAARAAAITTIFNPAPAQAEIADEILALTDIFCPNETEAELLTGLSVATLEDAEVAARRLVDRGAKAVVVTLGARGALLVRDGQPAVRVESPGVSAADTSGAGDAFVGSLAAYLAADVSLIDAIERACRVAAISVQHPGTQKSYPVAADLPDDLRLP